MAANDCYNSQIMTTRLVIEFDDGAQLHFREYVDTAQVEPLLMYAYHFQDAEQRLVFRYDNAAHRPRLPKVEHKRTADGVEVSIAPTLREVLDIINARWT